MQTPIRLRRRKYGNVQLIAYLLLILSNSANAQAFQKTYVRDLAKMSNNWGIAVADYDKDGDLDIFVTAYESFRSNKPETWSRLLKNNGSGWFVDATTEAGFRQQYSNYSAPDNKIGAAWGDFNNDHYPDLLLTHAGHIQLFENDTEGHFIEVTEAANLSSCESCVNASALWWDYDKDGYLDLYISDYQESNRLFKNQGDGTFVDTSESTGLADGGDTWCSIPIDANRDGWMDLYVINDFGQSRFYINQNGESFQEATATFGLRNNGNAMGATIGDYNNDGNFDIYITNIADFQLNALFTGSDSGGFQDQNEIQQVGNGHWGWGTRLFDADHDGDEDLYLVNGFADLTYPNKFFKNLQIEGQNHFMDWSRQAAVDDMRNGMALEVFDYDEDGDLDMLVANTNEAPYLYQNIGRAPHTNWLQIELEGTASNPHGFGSVIKAVGNGRSFYRFHHGAGIMSQSITPVHFGLGGIDQLDSLIISWPNSETEIFLDVPVNRTIRVIEHNALITSTAQTPKSVSQHTSLQIQTVKPNPFSESVQLDLSTAKAGDLSFTVYTTNGQAVWKEERWVIPSEELQLRWAGVSTQKVKLPAGLYMYTIRFNDDYLHGKLILQR